MQDVNESGAVCSGVAYEHWTGVAVLSLPGSRIVRPLLLQNLLALSTPARTTALSTAQRARAHVNACDDRDSTHFTLCSGQSCSASDESVAAHPSPPLKPPPPPASNHARWIVSRGILVESGTFLVRGTSRSHRGYRKRPRHGWERDSGTERRELQEVRSARGCRFW